MLLQRLRQPVGEALGVLCEVPLGVAHHARAVVEHAEQVGAVVAAPGIEHAARADVEVGVPQRVDVGELVASHLARGEVALGSLRARGVSRGAPGLSPEPMRLQVAAHGGVRRHRPERGIVAHERGEVIRVQLRAPARMRLILCAQHRAQPLAEASVAPGIGAPARAQRTDRIGAGAAGGVVPALNGGEGEAHRLAADRMAPGSGRQRRDRRAQCARLRRRHQQRTDHREAQPRPAFAPAHRVLVAHRAPPRVGQLREAMRRRARGRSCIFCGLALPLSKRAPHRATTGRGRRAHRVSGAPDRRPRSARAARLAAGAPRAVGGSAPGPRATRASAPTPHATTGASAAACAGPRRAVPRARPAGSGSERVRKPAPPPPRSRPGARESAPTAA